MKQGKCLYCLETTVLTKDHFYPKSKGGTTTIDCCDRCNKLKGNQVPLQFINTIKLEKSLTSIQKGIMIGSTIELINKMPVELDDITLLSGDQHYEDIATMMYDIEQGLQELKTQMAEYEKQNNLNNDEILF